MKYNPKINEKLLAYLDLQSHILYKKKGKFALEIVYSLQEELKEITGMDEVTLQPQGAHGEWTALMIFKAYHLDNGEGHRDEVIVPDLMVQTLHLRRLSVLKLTVKSNERGEVDIEDLKRVVNENTQLC